MKSVVLLALFSIVAALEIDYRYLHPSGDKLVGGDAPTAVVFPRGDIYVFGGQTANFSAEVNTAHNALYKYNVFLNHVTLLHPTGGLPAARTFHSSFTVGSNTVFILGGIAYSYFFDSITVFNDFWSYDIRTNAWTQVTPTGVTFPALASSVLEQAEDGTVYIFGGVDATFAAHSDLYKYDVGHNRLTLLNPAGAQPEARYHAYHAAVDDGFFMTGGVRTDQSYIEDYWFFSYDTQSWTQVPTPSTARPLNRTHGVTGRIGDKFLVALGDLVIGGGNCPGIIFGQSPVNDTWIYNIESDSYQQVQASPNAPFSKYSGDVTYGDSVYAFGGYSFDVPTCTQTYNNDILRAHFDFF